MNHRYQVYVFPKGGVGKRDLYSSIPGIDKQTDTIECQDGECMASIMHKVRALGHACSTKIVTDYDLSDALTGQLAILWVGPRNSDAFRAKFPMDAFEYPPGCTRCGLGSIWNRPHVLSAQAKRCGSNFYFSETHDGTSYIPFMKTEIAQKVIEATGIRECMRHPVLKSGEIVKEWMEAVPQIVMPGLSTKSEGIMWDMTRALSTEGGPAQHIDPCPACGRRAWADSNTEPRRLVYSKHACRLANKHGVAWMREPIDGFPEYDATTRSFKSTYCWPRLLLSLKAVEAMLPYCQMEPIRQRTYFEPVFSE